MTGQYLYKQLDAISSMDFIKKQVPDSMTQNLNPKFELRPYQVEAFVRMLDRQMQNLQAQYEQIYLLRNEGHFSVYNYGDSQALNLC